MPKPVAPFSHVIAAVRCAFAGLLLCGAGAAWAGFITTMETELESIFSQTGFGSNSIDVRFNAGLTVANTALLSIGSNVEFADLSEQFDVQSGLLVYSDRPTINMFFVDAITVCGTSSNSNILGCGTESGNVLVLKSSSAANGSTGVKLVAHELGHNFGLPHLNATNLMNPTISAGSSFDLTADQITTILGSDLVQLDGTQRFVAITPIAVVTSVPEMHAWAMLGLGLVALTGWVRRKRVYAC